MEIICFRIDWIAIISIKNSTNVTKIDFCGTSSKFDFAHFLLLDNP